VSMGGYNILANGFSPLSPLMVNVVVGAVSGYIYDNYFSGTSTMA